MASRVSAAPQRALAPWVLAGLTLLVALGSGAWSYAALSQAESSSYSAEWIAQDHEVLARVVGLFPVLVAILSTLTIVAWVKERRRQRQRRRLLRRLNAASGLAASVALDIDLLESGSPYSRDTGRDVFDALELEAQQLLQETEEVRSLALSRAWREASPKENYLTGSVEVLLSRAGVLRRKAQRASAPMDTQRSADPLGTGWAASAAAISEEFERTMGLLGPTRRSITASNRVEPSAAAAVLLQRAKNAWETAISNPDVVGNPDALNQSDATLAARHELATRALAEISDTLTARLAQAEARQQIPEARTAARALTTGQLDALPTPWTLVTGPVVTPDAFTAVAGPLLTQERERARPKPAVSGYRRSAGIVFGRDGVLAQLMRIGDVRLTALVLVFVFGALVGLSVFVSGTLVSFLPVLGSTALFPWLGLIAGLALSLVPWAVAGLVFLLNDGGPASLRGRRKDALGVLEEAGGRLDAVTARWDETMLALVERHQDTATSRAFSRRRDSFEASHLAALRTRDELESASAAEQSEDVFLREAHDLLSAVERLETRQDEALAA